MRLMAIMMVIAGILGLAKHLLVDAIPVNVDGLFAMWVVAISASWALFDRQLAWWLRVGLLGLVFLWVYWSFGLNASWLAGWLPGVVALAVVAWRRSSRLLIVFSLFFVVAIVMNTEYLERTLEAERQTSLLTRLDAWQQNWLVTREHLLFGTGPGGYAAYYISYFPTMAMATHNNYIDILAQTGLLGLSMLVWFLASLIRSGLRVARRLQGRGDFSEAIANAALAGTVGAVVIAAFGDWLMPFAYTQGITGFDHAVYTWMFMGMILAVDRLTSNNQMVGEDRAQENQNAA
jgi:O-antigen ligase